MTGVVAWKAIAAMGFIIFNIIHEERSAELEQEDLDEPTMRRIRSAAGRAAQRA